MCTLNFDNVKLFSQSSFYLGDYADPPARMRLFLSHNYDLKTQIKAVNKEITNFLFGITSITKGNTKPEENTSVRLAQDLFDLSAEIIANEVMKYGLEVSMNRMIVLKSDIENYGPFIKVKDEYLQLHIFRLRLYYQKNVAAIEEKEQRKQALEAKREEARAQRELAAELKRAQRDEEVAREAIERAQMLASVESENSAERKRLMAKIDSLNNALAEALQRAERAMSMAQQTRCGYVYIISNIGAFGEGVYKIGMTRRVEPLDRVRELGDASVPFPFDVHAMIYSEDAPSLEASLHARFSAGKVNLVNGRKEYFRVPLDEIKNAVAELGAEADFTDEPLAQQFIDSKFLRESRVVV